jgi:hypothetical protein
MSTRRPQWRKGLALVCMVLVAHLAAWRPLLVADESNLVKNGSFEAVSPDGVPVGWRTQGHKGIEQVITTDAGPDGKKALKLACTKVVIGFPDSHAMAALQGAVGVKKSRSYRLTWWAKGKAMPGEVSPAVAATIELTRTGPWTRVFCRSFRVFASWKRYEEVFEAPDDLPEQSSRFSFYMKSTGTLWLSDVSLTPICSTQAPVEWWPQISTKDATNLLPNSDFECDAQVGVVSIPTWRAPEATGRTCPCSRVKSTTRPLGRGRSPFASSLTRRSSMSCGLWV